MAVVAGSVPVRRVVWFAAAVVAVAVLAGLIVWSWQPAPSGPSGGSQQGAVDVSDLPGWWESNYSGASWYPVVSVPTWDGNVLTAKTSLQATEAAREPAMSVCGALSAYWLTKPGKLEDTFRSVRVLDGAGQVLVSRHTVGEQCTWRRS